MLCRTMLSIRTVVTMVTFVGCIAERPATIVEKLWQRIWFALILAPHPRVAHLCSLDHTKTADEIFPFLHLSVLLSHLLNAVLVQRAVEAALKTSLCAVSREFSPKLLQNPIPAFFEIRTPVPNEVYFFIHVSGSGGPPLSWERLTSLWIDFWTARTAGA